METFFELGVDAGIAHLKLNRPERMNTMTPVFFAALRDAVRGLHGDGGTRVLVISSTGRHFSRRAGRRLCRAVVTAPMTARRPVQVSVRPPFVPTFRSHLPSWISRSAASTARRSAVA